MPAKKALEVFSEEERAAMREAVRERRARTSGRNEDGERDVLAKIAAMPPPDRALAERIHRIVRSTAPELVPRTWYGMPAYSKDGEIVCFFKPASKFKSQYATFGFSEDLRLGEGAFWPNGYGIAELRTEDEAKIAALVRRAVS